MGGPNDYPIGQHQPAVPGQPSADDIADPAHSVSAVLKSLKWHSLLSLLDLSMVLLSSLLCLQAGRVVFYVLHIFVCYLLPFVVVRMSFEKMDGVGKYCFTMVCSNDENIFS